MSRRAPHSLRGRLLWFLLAAILVTALAQGLAAYRTARSEADAIFDYQMQQMALSLRSGLPMQALPGIGADPFANQSFEFVIQVWSADGLRIFESAADAALPQRAVLGFSDVAARGTVYRVFSMQTRTQIIQIAQDLAARSRMAGQLALRTVAPVAVVAPVLMLLVWWVVSASLAPVARVRDQVAARQADDLGEVVEDGLPAEIRPLVHELNLLFGRVRQAFDAQQNFVADAAHELRSPLAALKLQVQTLQRAGDETSRELGLVRLAAGIDRATRLVEQLLALARHQASAAGGAPALPVPLAAVARAAVSDAAAAAHDRGIDLGLSRADEAIVPGHREALAILVRNLVDNALRYTPDGGSVDVAVTADGSSVVLSVDDSGPGIAPADRDRVLDRFHRAGDGSTSGSGLGLAIVKAVAELHGATLALGASTSRGGLRVDVCFAAASQSVAAVPPAGA